MGVVANAPSCKVYMQLLPIAFKEVSLRLNFIESLAAIFVVLYHYVPEKNVWSMYIDSETVVQTCSIKKLFSKFLQNLQENTCFWISFPNKVADTAWKVSVFFCILTDYGDLRSKSPYLVRIQQNTDQK